MKIDSYRERVGLQPVAGYLLQNSVENSCRTARKSVECKIRFLEFLVKHLL